MQDDCVSEGAPSLIRYASEHRHPMNRALHAVGIPVVLLSLATVVSPSTIAVRLGRCRRGATPYRSPSSPDCGRARFVVRTFASTTAGAHQRFPSLTACVKRFVPSVAIAD